MPTEADTCRTYVLPKLYRADWKDDQLRKQELGQLLFSVSLLDEQRRIFAYLDGLQTKVNTLRELQSANGEEL
jgi:hypothetical protein